MTTSQTGPAGKHVRIVHPSSRGLELSNARCVGEHAITHPPTHCPRHSVHAYAAWHSKHRMERHDCEDWRTMEGRCGYCQAKLGPAD